MAYEESMMAAEQMGIPVASPTTIAIGEIGVAASILDKFRENVGLRAASVVAAVGGAFGIGIAGAATASASEKVPTVAMQHESTSSYKVPKTLLGRPDLPITRNHPVTIAAADKAAESAGFRSIDLRLPKLAPHTLYPRNKWLGVWSFSVETVDKHHVKHFSAPLKPGTLEKPGTKLAENIELAPKPMPQY